MADPFLGEVRMFGGTFAPEYWAFCNGDYLQISQYSALFAVIGTNFGGDGRTTFCTPNLKGCAPMGSGYGTGLSPRYIGQASGYPQIALTTAQIPGHTHQLTGSGEDASTETPSSAELTGVTGGRKGGAPIYGTNEVVPLSSASLSAAGSSVAHSNMQPYLAVYFIICLDGLFPSRS